MASALDSRWRIRRAHPGLRSPAFHKRIIARCQVFIASICRPDRHHSAREDAIGRPVHVAIVPGRRVLRNIPPFKWFGRQPIEGVSRRQHVAAVAITAVSHQSPPAVNTWVAPGKCLRHAELLPGLKPGASLSGTISWCRSTSTDDPESVPKKCAQRRARFQAW